MPQKIEFMLLDSSYEIIGKEPVIVLWGLLPSGERAVLFDKRFRPYFYALLAKHATDYERVVSRIRGLSKPSSPIINVSLLDKKYFGRPRKAVRVTTVIPEYVRIYREEVRRINSVEEVLEADIRFAMRYLIDKHLFPFHVYEAEVEEIKSLAGYRVHKVFNIVSDPRLKEDAPIQNYLSMLRVLAFDIEVYSRHGSPNPNTDPVIIIAVMDSSGQKKLFEAERYDDKRAIREFVNYIKSFDPDIVVGYNNNEFDWPYLLNRAHRLGIKLDVTRRVGAEPTTSVHGHISVPGRLNVDLYDYAEEMHEIKVKTLEEVAEYLGVMKKSERVLIEWWRIPEYWDDPKKRGLLRQYALDDVVSTYGLAEKMLPFAIQLSTVTGVPLDQVGAMGVGFRLEWYLIRAAYDMNELVPNRVERREESYRGAIVLKPLRGVHENIAVLDFSSMYPNIMIKYNVGPDTIVDDPAECERYGGCYVAPEVGHRFRKEPPGFFKTVLVNLVSLRKKVREEMKKYPVDSPEYRLLDERQKALKVLANASYGYMGWTGARWYCRRCAEAVTAWGRNLIRSAIEYARKLGLKVIYGDTDSLFVTYDPEKVKKLIEYVEKELGFEIKIDKIYKRVFFTEAKKRYAGILKDGRIDIVGFEAVRGDWCELAKEVQATTAEIVLKTGNVDQAIEYVRKVIKELKEGKIPIEKLIIWKTLSKKLDEYEHEAPHVVAAKRMRDAGYEVSPGDKIGYVIVKGRGSISSRAYPYFMVKPGDIDVEYYIDRQIIPAALRILGYFGVTENQLKAAAAAGQRSLFEFFTAKRGK